MHLTGSQLQKFHSALLSAFPSRSDLERMLLFQLNVRLNQIAGSGSLSDTVFEVVRWAEAQGRLDELIAGARTQNPGNPELAAFERSLAATVPLPIPGADDRIHNAPVPIRPVEKATTMSMSVPLEVFFSYAHEDEKLRDELAKHLKLLQRQGVISAWHDRQITPGGEWKGAIDRHLESARIILLLVSPDFMASDYCWDVETARAMQRHDACNAVVIPIALRPVDWHGAPFSRLQGLPKDIKPVTSWADKDEAFLNIAQGIRTVAQSLSKA